MLEWKLASTLGTTSHSSANLNRKSVLSTISIISVFLFDDDNDAILVYVLS